MDEVVYINDISHADICIYTESWFTNNIRIFCEILTYYYVVLDEYEYRVMCEWVVNQYDLVFYVE